MGAINFICQPFWNLSATCVRQFDFNTLVVGSIDIGKSTKTSVYLFHDDGQRFPQGQSSSGFSGVVTLMPMSAEYGSKCRRSGAHSFVAWSTTRGTASSISIRCSVGCVRTFSLKREVRPQLVGIEPSLRQTCLFFALGLFILMGLVCVSVVGDRSDMDLPVQTVYNTTYPAFSSLGNPPLYSTETG